MHLTTVTKYLYFTFHLWITAYWQSKCRPYGFRHDLPLDNSVTLPPRVSLFRCLCLQGPLGLADASGGSAVREHRPPAEHPDKVSPGAPSAAPSWSGHVCPALRHAGRRPKRPAHSGPAGVQSALCTERGLPLTQSGLQRP